MSDNGDARPDMRLSFSQVERFELQLFGVSVWAARSAARSGRVWMCHPGEPRGQPQGFAAHQIDCEAIASNAELLRRSLQRRSKA